MNKQSHHNITVNNSYNRRKVRSNVTIKTHAPAYRAIAGKSNLYNELTVIDTAGRVVVQMIDKDLKGTKLAKALELGKKVASMLQTKKIESVVFDRNGFKYIGRVKNLCEGLREGGIVI